MATFAPADQFNQIIKIVLVGETNVGKTALVHWFVRNQNPPKDISSTIGVEFSKRLIEVPQFNMRAQIHIWDTAGQERFKSLTTHHYKGAQGALLVFDITNKNSFQQAELWLKELTDNTPQNCRIALISNKCDLEEQERVISQQEVKKFAKQMGLIYYETSSFWDRDDQDKPGERGGISVLIQSIVTDIVKECIQEDPYIMYQNQTNSTPASASQKNFGALQEKSNPRAEAHEHMGRYDEYGDPQVRIKDEKLWGGREKTDIKMHGLRLDKESMFEIDNNSEKNCNC